jgi:hypothetical protein
MEARSDAAQHDNLLIQRGIDKFSIAAAVKKPPEWVE